LQAPSSAHIRDHFLPLPASTLMYWVSTSKTESKTGHDVGCESSSAAERIIKEEDQGHDVRVERLASLGYQCVVQQDGTLPPSCTLFFLYHSAYSFKNSCASQVLSICKLVR